MSRPRQSVLQLFDPLSTRDAPSPDSDKENSSPVAYLYPQYCIPHPNTVVRLTRRLVDIGETTILEEEEEQAVDEQGDVNEVDEHENDTVTGPNRPPSPRTPLADVTFDRERTPMRSKMYKRKAAPAEAVVPNAVAHVIHEAITEGDATLAVPSVMISAPEENLSGSTDSSSTSLATLPLATPTCSLLMDTAIALPTPSEASSSLLISMPPFSSQTAALVNLDYSSGDLQTSFALHMNMNAETSFDLLNDRISFLGLGDEASFDTGKDSGPVSQQEEIDGERLVFIDPLPGTPGPSSSRSNSPPNPRPVPNQSPDTAQPTDAPVTPVQPSVEQPSFPPVFVAPAVRRISPVPVLSTSLPEPPALVPALKIVKRKRPGTTVAPQATVRTSTVENHLSSRPGRVVATKEAATSVVPMKAPALGRYVTEGPGPWRVPIVSSDEEKKASAPVNSRKPVARSAPSGPRRVPLDSSTPSSSITPTAAVPTAPKAKALSSEPVTALKRPLRMVPPNAPASGLLRVASGSRLPMPKSKIPPPTAGTGLPRKRVV
ncbi:J domain-containing protein [Favolaschia claudopus]|uniref:J domain-containing protein n=1 Tax=Favolaschia claudopus TaxID=2862362 RepID=A0AAW0EII6_9AGAR